LPMSRAKRISVLIASILFLSAALARAQQQQPLGIIAVDWNTEGAVGAQRNPDLIYKKLRAAFADTLKKKLNVDNPPMLADLEMMNEGRNLRFVIVSKGAVQPTPDEVLTVVRDSFLEVVN